MVSLSPVITQSSEETAKLLAAPPFDEPDLTLSWIRGQMSTNGAKGFFKEFHRIASVMDVFYDGEFDFYVPEGADKVNLGTFRSIIKTLVAHVKPTSIDITVPPPGPRGQGRAAVIEEFLSGAHHQLEENTPWQRDIIKHEGLYGVGWEKLEFEGSEWGEVPLPPPEGQPDEQYKKDLREFQEKRNITFPFISEAINPQELIWDPVSINPRWLIRFYDTDAAWVTAHFPDWSGRTSGNIRFLEVWTSSQVAYVGDDTWAMRPVDHGYKTPSNAIGPWIMYDPNQGNKTVGAKPHQRWQGIVVNGELDMHRAQSRLFSQLLTVTGTNAWPVEEFKGPRGITEEVMAEYETAPGSRNYLPPNVERSRSDVAEAPQSVILAKQMASEAIEESSVPAVARGQRPTGSASGFHTAVLAGIAALNFGGIVDATQRGFQGANMVMLSIVENVIRDSVSVFGMTEAGTFDAKIKPSQIRGHYVSIVRFSSVSPEEQERKLNIWSQRWREGFVDWVTALRNAGVANPLKVIAQRRSEDFLQNPLIAEAFAMEAAKRIPLIAASLEAAGLASGNEANQIAQNILNTAGETQLPNPGNFSSGNQPPNAGTGAQQIRQGPQTRPVIPGSLGEAQTVGRQLAGPRSGPARAPGATLGPGLGGG